jgi:hypothetical protein
MLFLLFYHYIRAVTHVFQYVAFIISGVASVQLGSVFRGFGSVYLHDTLRTCCNPVFVSCSALSIVVCQGLYPSLVDCFCLFFVVFFWCVRMFPFPIFPYDVQCTCYGSAFVFCVQYVV